MDSGSRRAAALVQVLLLAALALPPDARGDDWYPRRLYPVLRELGITRGRAARPARRPDDPPQDPQQSPQTSPDEPQGEALSQLPSEPSEPRPSAAPEAPLSPAPNASAEAAPAEPTPAQASGSTAAATPAASSAHPLARKLANLAALLALAIGAARLWARMRRRGDLVVVIDYPPDQRGNFRVRVARSAEPKPSERRAGVPSATATAPALAPKSTRTERFLVTREAQFSKLAARRYWIVVEGELRDPGGDRVLPCFAQRAARVEPGRTLRLDFAFAPTAPDPLEAAEALVEEGRADLALEALEAARLREPAVPHLATRIEELRKRIEADAAAEARPHAPAKHPVASRYEILEEVGRGGMAVVYRARDTRLDRIVALKRISDSLREHPRAVDLLLREARSAARLNHPHIVTVFDVDQEAGSYFITMEFLEGKPLLGLLQRRGRFAAKPVAWLGQQVAAGLAYAHERGVVHRDIKTANLFVLRSHSLKIMDFGLAKMLEEVRRRATLIGGTPSYMAPEQSQGLEVDGRADLYAFGVTLFELLTGALPFQDGDLADQHRRAPPPDPRGLAKGIPDAMAELVLQLLAKRPEDRPASAGDVEARLRAIESSVS